MQYNTIYYRLIFKIHLPAKIITLEWVNVLSTFPQKIKSNDIKEI